MKSLFLLITCLSISFDHSFAADAKKPNILILLADDVGFADTAFTHGLFMPHAADRPPEVKTPNLDRLAHEGIIFSNGYANGNVCSPTRAGLMLGRYQQRVGVYEAGEGGSGMAVLLDNGGGEFAKLNPIFPAWLKSPGVANPYVCGVFGKWHLGLDEVYTSSALNNTVETSYSIGGVGGYGLPLNGPFTNSSPATGSPWHPLNRGFDVSFNFMDRGAHDYWDPNDIYTGLAKAGGLPTRANPNGDGEEPTTVWDQAYTINPERRPTNYLARRITEAACAFIRNKASNGIPFFCYVPFNSAHSPAQAPYHMDANGVLETLSNTNGNRYRNVDDDGWFAYDFDDSVWFPDPLYIYKKYPNMGLPAYLAPGTPAEADTLRRQRAVTLAMVRWLDKGVGRIIQTLKDQGIYDNTLVIFFSDNGGASGMVASNKPLRGHKSNNWEGGTRVPFCLNWPAYLNSLPPGQQGGRVIRAPIISMDILPTVLEAAGITNRIPAPAGFNYAFDGKSWLPLIKGTVTNLHDSLRWSDGSTGGGAVCVNKWKLVIDQATYSLYDLDKDVSEVTNLAALYPDVVRELRQNYYAWMVDVAASAGEPPRLWTTVTPPPTRAYAGLMVENFDYLAAALTNYSSLNGGPNWPAAWTITDPGNAQIAAGSLTFADPSTNYIDDATGSLLLVGRKEVQMNRSLSGAPVAGPVWLSCLVGDMFDNATNTFQDQICWQLRINDSATDCLRVGEGATPAGRTRFVANGADVNLNVPLTLTDQRYLVVMRLQSDIAGPNDSVKAWIIPQGTRLSGRTEAALHAAAGGSPNLTLTNLDIWSNGVSRLGLFGQGANNNDNASVQRPKIDNLRVIYGLPTDTEMIEAVLSGNARLPDGGSLSPLEAGFTYLNLRHLPATANAQFSLEYDVKSGWFPNGVRFFVSSNLPAAGWAQVAPVGSPTQLDRWADMETHQAAFLMNTNAPSGFFRVGYPLAP